jgi:hypothetical protein
MPCGHPDNSNLHRGEHLRCGCTERELDRACDYRLRRNWFSICAERATDALFESHDRFVVQYTGVFGDLKSGRLRMFAKVRAAWTRLAMRRETRDPDASITPVIEYKGCRIRPTPYGTNGQYQTAGVIERDPPDGVKEHRFVRADTHQNRDDAIEFTISKAKQMIDLQGDRMFI